jgi:hypothetical protein
MAEATQTNPNPPEADLTEEEEPQDMNVNLIPAGNPVKEDAPMDQGRGKGGRGRQGPRAPMEPHVTIVTMYDNQREPKPDHLHLISIKNYLFTLLVGLIKRKID